MGNQKRHASLECSYTHALARARAHTLGAVTRAPRKCPWMQLYLVQQNGSEKYQSVCASLVSSRERDITQGEDFIQRHCTLAAH